MKTQEVLDKIKGCKTLKQIEILMKEILPGWCLGFLNKFSDDYPVLTKNWYSMCKKINIKPTQIMLVKNIDISKKQTPESLFSECFSKAGFCVRRITEFNYCPNCLSAIPTEKLYNIIKENNNNIPKKWSQYCINCN